MELDLRQLLRIGRQYWWLVIVLMMVAGGTAYWRSSKQPDLYRTTSQVLLVGGEQESDTYRAQVTSLGLLQTYGDLVHSDIVLERVIGALQLPYDVVSLDSKVAIASSAENLIIGISVIDTDPGRAAEIADEVARQFIQYISERQNFTLSSGVEVAGFARVPSVPFEPKPVTAGLLGAFVGLLLAVATIALLEFLDNTVKPTSPMKELTGSPLLATIPSLDGMKPGPHQAFSVAQPRSPAAEAMRLIRTNLEFASASSPVDRILVTSPNAGEGKSTLVANLGIVMAQSGLRTVIVDADLRRPTQDRVFGVSGSEGLTTLLTHPERSWETIAKKVAVPNLLLIPSGPLPPDPADLVSSRRFADLLARISAEVDLVVIDAPPMLVASDALAIAAETDGVLLVCHANRTRLDALSQVTESFRDHNIRLIGVVLNRAKQQRATYYGRYYNSTKAPATGD